MAALLSLFLACVLVYMALHGLLVWVLELFRHPNQLRPGRILFSSVREKPPEFRPPGGKSPKPAAPVSPPPPKELRLPGGLRMLEEEKSSSPAPQPEEAPPPETGPPPASSPNFLDRPIRPIRFLQFLFRAFQKQSIRFQVGVAVFAVGALCLLRHGAVHMRWTAESGFALALAGGMSLLGMGWFLARFGRSRGYDFQGVAIAALFAALFLGTEAYPVFPPVVGFLAMGVVAWIGGTLAAAQHAPRVAVLAIAGGFFALLLNPVPPGDIGIPMASFFILSAGIFLVSIRRPWPKVHLLGLACTAFLGLVWSQNLYDHPSLGMVQGFLAAFFLLYSALVLRHGRHPSGMEESAPVLGMAAAVPILFLGFQKELALEIPQFMAANCAALSLFYAGATLWMRRRSPDRIHHLLLLHLVLAAVTGNLAVPLALPPDQRISVATLLAAGQGALLLHFGGRLKLPFLANLGCGFHLLAVVLLARFSSFYRVDGLTCVAGLAASVSLLASAWSLDRGRETAIRFRNEMATGMVVLGLILWLGAGYVVFIMRLPVEFANTATLLLLSGTAWAMYGLARRGWDRMGRFLDAVFGPALLLFAAGDFLPGPPVSQIPFEPSPFAWPVAIVSWYYLLFLRERDGDPDGYGLHHRLGFWTMAAGLAAGGYFGLKPATPAGTVWPFVAAGLGLGLAGAVGLFGGERVRWPVAVHSREYRGAGLAPVLLAAWGWVLMGCLSDGDPRPLAYWPLFNPLEIVQLLCLLLILAWKRMWIDRTDDALVLPSFIRRHLSPALYGAAFIWLTAVVARTVNVFTSLELDGGLVLSPAFQTGLSVTWSAISVLALFLSGRMENPRLERMGVLLLFLVVAKLFLVDFFLSDDLGRAVSFMWVGVLMTVSETLTARESAEANGANTTDGEEVLHEAG
jgi:uncharacterized membrane protein